MIYVALQYNSRQLTGNGALLKRCELLDAPARMDSTVLAEAPIE
jgi:hypothetical protein